METINDIGTRQQDKDLLYGLVSYNLIIVLSGDNEEYQYHVIGKKDTERFLDPRFHMLSKYTDSHGL